MLCLITMCQSVKQKRADGKVLGLLEGELPADKAYHIVIAVDHYRKINCND